MQAGIESGLDVLATALHLTATDVIALQGQNLQFADLRLGLPTCNVLHHKDTHVETDESTLAAADVDIDFLLFVFLGSGTSMMIASRGRYLLSQVVMWLDNLSMASRIAFSSVS